MFDLRGHDMSSGFFPAGEECALESEGVGLRSGAGEAHFSRLTPQQLGGGRSRVIQPAAKLPPSRVNAGRIAGRSIQGTKTLREVLEHFLSDRRAGVVVPVSQELAVLGPQQCNGPFFR